MLNAKYAVFIGCSACISIQPYYTCTSQWLKSTFFIFFQYYPFYVLCSFGSAVVGMFHISHAAKLPVVAALWQCIVIGIICLFIIGVMPCSRYFIVDLLQ